MTPSAAGLRSQLLGKHGRQRATAEMRRQQGWTKAESRAFYERLVHFDKLKAGRSVVDALGQAGR